MFELIPFARKNTEYEFHPFRELENFQRNFFGTSNAFSSNNPLALRTDIEETDEAYVLRADLPGVGKEDIDLQIEDDILTVKAERRAAYQNEDEKKRFVRIERGWGVYTRSFDVSGIDVDQISAAYTDGVLTLQLPKKVEKAPEARRLEIQ